MAAKKSSGKRGAPAAPSLQQQAEQLQRQLGESAQQIWLAGLGALGRARSKGSQWFETLVQEGSQVEQQAGASASKLRDAVDERVQGARARAAQAFGRVDQTLRGKVQHAFKSLEVPTRRELGALLDRIGALNAQLRNYNGQSAPPARKARKSAAPATSAASTRPVAKKAPAKQAAASKAAKPAASKTAVRKSARKVAASKRVR